MELAHFKDKCAIRMCNLTTSIASIADLVCIADRQKSQQLKQLKRIVSLGKQQQQIKRPSSNPSSIISSSSLLIFLSTELYQQNCALHDPCAQQSRSPYPFGIKATSWLTMKKKIGSTVLPHILQVNTCRLWRVHLPHAPPTTMRWAVPLLYPGHVNKLFRSHIHVSFRDFTGQLKRFTIHIIVMPRLGVIPKCSLAGEILSGDLLGFQLTIMEVRYRRPRHTLRLTSRYKLLKYKSPSARKVITIFCLILCAELSLSIIFLCDCAPTPPATVQGQLSAKGG
jgi:hypothetical protein